MRDSRKGSALPKSSSEESAVRMVAQSKFLGWYLPSLISSDWTIFEVWLPEKVAQVQQILAKYYMGA